MQKVILVCLANSRKHSGHCLAGKAMFDGSYSRWVRPVTSHPSQALNLSNQRLTNGKDCALLDIVEASLLEPKPHQHQQENWLLDETVPLRKLGLMAPEEVGSLLDTPKNIWGIGSSTSTGLNDKVTQIDIGLHYNSLNFIEVDKLIIRVQRRSYPPYATFVSGEFSYNGTDYILKITDPVYEQAFKVANFKEYELGMAYLTISLGENFNDNYYKLIAGIISVSKGRVIER